ncbi:stage III sporulation protein AA [Ruminococcus sp. YRD2003]|uniref:ATPase, T2SS/T4P/T4SS family n=1 Tax=Ruminococcus sp. YRD2003 TaxID=1452313 RepID=UPI0008BF180A|nr:stage III sporulation protein AA [Ruminococcus flavefaciens]
MNERTSLEIIADHLSERLRVTLLRSVGAISSEVTEIRLYLGQPVAAVFPDRIAFLTGNSLTASSSNTSCVRCTAEDIRKTIDSVTHFSFHSHVSEFRQGYFIVGNGIRAGISGVYNLDGIITEVTGISFRISRCVIGCADELVGLIDGGLLICGGVNSGKTTLLRDISRMIGRRKKVALIDERGEIAAVSGGQFGSDVGVLTNVMSGCPRNIGVVSAIRSLSPDWIICDEIADDSDTEAMLAGAGCGISFIATVHANSFEALKRRPFAKKLLSAGLFARAAFLAGASSPGKVLDVREL